MFNNLIPTEANGFDENNSLFVFFRIDDIKFKISVFFNEDYSARDKSLTFKNLAVELLISRTNKGYLNIQSAKLLEK